MSLDPTYAMIRTPIFMWCVALEWTPRKTCVCLLEIGLRAQSMLSSPGSIVNVIVCVCKGGVYNHLMSMRIFTLIMNKMFIRASSNMRQMETGIICMS